MQERTGTTRTHDIFPGDKIISAKWKALGGAAVLGNPVSKHFGSVWTFAAGSCLCYDPNTDQAHFVYGAIYQKWLSLRGMAFGVPNTDELGTTDDGPHQRNVTVFADGMFRLTGRLIDVPCSRLAHGS